MHALEQVDLVKEVQGNFDLTQLSKVIGDCIGADEVLNKANKKDAQVSETFVLRSRLMQIGVPDVSTSTIKNYVNFAGMKLNKNRVNLKSSPYFFKIHLS